MRDPRVLRKKRWRRQKWQRRCRDAALETGIIVVLVIGECEDDFVPGTRKGTTREVMKKAPVAKIPKFTRRVNFTRGKKKREKRRKKEKEKKKRKKSKRGKSNNALQQENNNFPIRVTNNISRNSHVCHQHAPWCV